MNGARAGAGDPAGLEGDRASDGGHLLGSCRYHQVPTLDGRQPPGAACVGDGTERDCTPWLCLCGGGVGACMLGCPQGGVGCEYLTCEDPNVACPCWCDRFGAGSFTGFRQWTSWNECSRGDAGPDADATPDARVLAPR
jgi:hypothetical protein